MKSHGRKLLLTILFGCATSHLYAEVTVERDMRMAWWREAKFGMFIPWGLYALHCQSAWLVCEDESDHWQHNGLARSFKAVQFEAAGRLRKAKATGQLTPLTWVTGLVGKSSHLSVAKD